MTQTPRTRAVVLARRIFDLLRRRDVGRRLSAAHHTEALIRASFALVRERRPGHAVGVGLVRMFVVTA